MGYTLCYNCLKQLYKSKKYQPYIGPNMPRGPRRPMTYMTHTSFDNPSMYSNLLIFILQKPNNLQLLVGCAPDLLFQRSTIRFSPQPQIHPWLIVTFQLIFQNPVTIIIYTTQDIHHLLTIGVATLYQPGLFCWPCNIYRYVAMHLAVMRSS